MVGFENSLNPTEIKPATSSSEKPENEPIKVIPQPNKEKAVDKRTTSDLPKKRAEQNEEGETEKKINKVDKIFDDLLDQVKNRPEAERQALTTLLEQMRQIAGEMREVRDLQHLQEMKVTMLNNWEKLKELTGGDENLLKTINEWGNRFNQEKVVFYDRINKVKDLLTNQAQSIQESWVSMQIQLGEAIGKIGNSHPEIKDLINEILYHRSLDLASVEGGDFTNWMKDVSGLEKFVESLNSAQTGFFDEDLNLLTVTNFTGNITRVLTELSTYANKGGIGGTPMINNPELKQVLEEMQVKLTKLTQTINEASKIYKVTKKIRDTQFLPVFNEQPKTEKEKSS